MLTPKLEYRRYFDTLEGRHTCKYLRFQSTLISIYLTIFFFTFKKLSHQEVTGSEKELSSPSSREDTDGGPQTDLHDQIVSLLEQLKTHSEKPAEVKKIARLIRVLIAENTELREEISKLREKETKIYEVLKTELGLDL